MLEDNNSEINVNLKIPGEQPQSEFSMKDFVLTMYRSRKALLKWCIIGLVAGVLLAGAYYVYSAFFGATLTDADTAITIEMNYPQTGGAITPAGAIFPNGAAFDPRTFANVGVLEKALAAVERTDVSATEVIPRLSIALVEGSKSRYVVTLRGMAPSDEYVFTGDGEKMDFLQALADEYREYLKSTYYIDETVGYLYNQHLGEMDACIREVDYLIPDLFSYKINFTTIGDYYTNMGEILDGMFVAEPAYISPEGFSFRQYALQMYEVRDKDIAGWRDKLSTDVYIRNPERFLTEYQHQIDTLRRDSEYYSELAMSFHELLDGTKVQDVVAQFITAQDWAVTAAERNDQIRWMEDSILVLQSKARAINANSVEAEAAYNAAMDTLKRDQAKIRKVLYEYYYELNSRSAENSVVYSQPVYAVAPGAASPAGSGVSLMRLALIVVGLTFVGAVVGVCVALMRKYVPEVVGDKGESRT